MLQLAAQEANPVAKERLNATQEHSGKLIEEIKDSENDLRLQEAKFPPVGCDRRAPPAKVGINLFQSQLEIVAYNGDEGEFRSHFYCLPFSPAEGNKIALDWADVTEFCSHKDGLAIKYKRKESEKGLKVFLVQSEIAVDVYSRIQVCSSYRKGIFTPISA